MMTPDEAYDAMCVEFLKQQAGTFRMAYMESMKSQRGRKGGASAAVAEMAAKSAVKAMVEAMASD